MSIYIHIRFEFQSFFFFFSSRRRHTRLQGDWSSDVCSSDLAQCCCPWSSHVRSPTCKRRRNALNFPSGGTNMRYQLTPISTRPWLLNGLSQRLIESHYENHYGGAAPGVQQNT